MLVFAMKAGQDHYASIILVKLLAKLVLDMEHALLPVILMPSVFVKMDSLVRIAKRAVMDFVLASSPTFAPEILMVL